MAERDHGIQGNPTVWVPVGQPPFDALLQQETGVARAVPHFDEVAQGQVANGISIGLAKGGEFPHQGPPFRGSGGAGVEVQQVGEDPGVLEAAVHALAIERHDGMGGIAQQDHAVAMVPRFAACGDEGAGGVAFPVGIEIWQQGQHVGEVGFEIGPGFSRCGQVREAILSLKGGEQGAGEGPVRVRQRHQHEMATGPDVQGFGIDGKVALCRWRHREFLVAVGEVGLAKVEPVRLHHPLAHGAEGAIRSEDAAVFHRIASFEMQGDALGVGGEVRQPVFEVNRDLAGGFRRFEEDAVQGAAGHGVDALVLAVTALSGQSVRLVGEHALPVVHAAGLDGQGNPFHSFSCARRFQRPPAAVAQGEVDGPTAGIAHLPGVGPALIDIHLMASVGQQQGGQAADQPCADDGDAVGSRTHRPIA